EVEATSLGDVFYTQQSEVWSPHGEARSLIANLNLSHTSMSVGDVVRAPNQSYWLCNCRGWTLLNDSVEDQGPPLWMSTEAEMRGQVPQITRLKIASERDYLPPDAYAVEQFGWTKFADLVVLAQKLEHYPGFAPGVRVCIDLGEEYYET